MIKRLFDIFTSILAISLLIAPLVILYFLVKLTSKGSFLHWSKRVGKNNKIFLMPKIRTMYIDTPQVATHLLQSSTSHVTPIGKILRKLSLDEIPQLYSVIINDMSLVGPRPALFNQEDLISLRTEIDVHTLKPGITGWAQINGRDNISITAKVALDRQYFENRSFYLDQKILFLTIFKSIFAADIQH